MGDIQKYYENTENALPHPMVKKFINMNSNPKYAIDLGCGAGRDTIYLIKNGWKVLSIDKENTSEIISSKLNNEELEKFNFECQDFENIELEKNNLLVANFSIPFCNKDYFDEFWKKIANSILKERILCWELFWIKRFLGKDKRTMVFLSKEQVLELFKNSFDIIEFNEVEKDGKTGLGKMKHWHIYNVIAKKK